jgi:hypothetical protein
MYVGPAYDPSFAEGFFVPSLATEAFDGILSGAECMRSEKIQLVAAFEPARRYLDVCIKPPLDGVNCSRCSKCVRTMVVLDIMGRLGDFRDVFDVARFQRNESQCVAALRHVARGLRVNGVDQDALDFRRRSGVKPPLSEHVYYLLQAAALATVRHAPERLRWRIQRFLAASSL